MRKSELIEVLQNIHVVYERSQASTKQGESKIDAHEKSESPRRIESDTDTNHGFVQTHFANDCGAVVDGAQLVHYYSCFSLMNHTSKVF